jgi:hypothetical protein
MITRNEQAKDDSIPVSELDLPFLLERPESDSGRFICRGRRTVTQVLRSQEEEQRIAESVCLAENYRLATGPQFLMLRPLLEPSEDPVPLFVGQ